MNISTEVKKDTLYPTLRMDMIDVTMYFMLGPKGWAIVRSQENMYATTKKTRMKCLCNCKYHDHSQSAIKFRSGSSIYKIVTIPCFLSFYPILTQINSFIKKTQTCTGLYSCSPCRVSKERWPVYETVCCLLI